jgi:hypothetical protein
MTPVHIITTYLRRIQYIYQDLPTVSFPLVLPTKICSISHLSLASYMPRPSHPPWFYHHNNIWWSVQIMKLIMQYNPASPFKCDIYRVINFAVAVSYVRLQIQTSCNKPTTRQNWVCEISRNDSGICVYRNLGGGGAWSWPLTSL